MEAPTPVSALIHAATMVNAGPYLLVRFSELVKLSPAAMTVIAIIGATTALFAAMVSLTQSDIKKNLAYSTISQIGFMIMTCGLGAFVVAIFHMLAHGFLKGFLFLSTGNQLESAGSHAHHTPTRPKLSTPVSIGALILACVPPVLIFSGPYEALWTVHNSTAAQVGFWVIGLLTVFFTAMYLFRTVTALFQPVSSALVQPPFFSSVHLGPISVGALGLIGILLALWVWFVPFLAPAIATPYPLADTTGSASHFPLLILALVVALAGWGLASLLHTSPLLSFVPHSDFAKTMYVLFLNKFYFDEVYSMYIVQPLLRMVKWLWREVDVRGINGLVHGAATAAVRLARWLWETVDCARY